MASPPKTAKAIPAAAWDQITPKSRPELGLCLLIEIDRKWPTDRQNDAIDPKLPFPATRVVDSQHPPLLT